MIVHWVRVLVEDIQGLLDFDSDRWAETTCDFFFFQAEDGIRDYKVTGVQTCALPISAGPADPAGPESPSDAPRWSPAATRSRAAPRRRDIARARARSTARPRRPRSSEDRKSVV